MSVKNACCDILSQLTHLVNQLSEHEYSKPIESLDHSSIGQHVRHTLEFFICLEQGFGTGSINYDKRSHDKLVETDKYLALSTLNRINEFVTSNTQNKVLSLEMNYSLDQEILISVETNYLRELIYNIEHAVHHMAIIKIGVREVVPHINLPSTFGIASSTLRYQERLQNASFQE
ncbi:MAG: DinB family protein [Cyclobacteriaceae bacterium]|nr:DinB family protein [Cyclobacteriaceae bacterium]